MVTLVLELEDGEVVETTVLVEVVEMTVLVELGEELVAVDDDGRMDEMEMLEVETTVATLTGRLALVLLMLLMLVVKLETELVAGVVTTETTVLADVVETTELESVELVVLAALL